ncbi:MAG: sodium:solute symporter family protein [Bacillota bacterium]
MRTTELAVTLIYIVVCIGIGLWARSKVRESKDDYWVAGRRVGVFTNTWAIMAALASGGSILGVTGLGYRLGLPYVFSMYAGAVVGFPIAAILVAKPLVNLGKYTITDFLTERFDSKLLKVVIPLIILISMGTYIVAQMKAAGVAAQYLLAISYNHAIILTSIVFILYVSIGGMWAVTVTDVLQGIIMVGMMLLVAVISLARFGGLGGLLTQATAVAPNIGQLVNMPMSSYVGAFVVWAAAIPVIPHIVMRIYTSKDVKSARLSLNYAMLIYAFMIFFGVVGISAGGHLLAPGLKDADTVYLIMVENFLPRVLGGLALAAVMAAVMSTTDALLLACASAVSHDLYERVINPKASDKTLVNISLVTTWVIGLLAMFFAFNPPKLLTMLYTAAVGLIVSSLFVPTILGIWWKGTNTQGATAGVLVGAVSYLWLLWFTKMPALSHVLVSLPLCLAVTVIVSLLSPPPSAATLERVQQLHR